MELRPQARADVRESLEQLQATLTCAQHQMRYALAAMAQASRVLPAAAEHLEPLMLREAEVARRLQLVDHLLSEVELCCCEQDAARITEHLHTLRQPGAVPASVSNKAALH
jgi:hypothetical protein